MAGRRDPLTGGICRECAAPTGPAGPCPSCASPRVARHPELTLLTVAHLDCDAFYAAIEKRDRPDLRHQPLIIGGSKRGVVAAACYIARIHGIHSAMPVYQALKACPHATVIAPDMAKYVAASRQVRALMATVSPVVEPLSIDEAFIDLSGTERLHGACAAATMITLARRIETEVGITVSIGLSYNKFLAKLASDLDKPRGFSALGHGDIDTVLAALPVSKIWGVGPALKARLTKDGIVTIGQLKKFDARTLTGRYGKIGHRLFDFCRGHDTRRVTPNAPTKSISSETTFNDDIADPTDLRPRVWSLCEKVAKRLKDKDLATTNVTLKLKTAAFATRTRSTTLHQPTQLADTLFRAAEPMLKREADGTSFRLIGVAASGLRSADGADQPDLAEPALTRRKNIESTIDAVRRKLGDQAITRGRSVRS